LKLDNDVGQFQISLLFQMCKNASAEEYLALTDSVKVGIELQCLNLHKYNSNSLSLLAMILSTKSIRHWHQWHHIHGGTFLLHVWWS